MQDAKVKSFLDSVEPIRGAYQNINFNFAAVRQEDKHYLLQGRLFLNASTLGAMPTTYRTANVMVGSILLKDIANSVEAFLEKVLAGSLTIEGQEVLFSSRDKQGYDTYHHPFHPEGLQNQNRLNVLTIRGNHISPYIKQPALDWEIMASDTPYGGLQDVAYEYGVGPINSDSVNVDVVAFQVAAVSSESGINGDKATVAVNVAANLSKEQAAIGYNVHQNNKVIQRGKLNAASLEWTAQDGHQSGKAVIDVPEGSIMQCFASYAGITQQRYWILDSSKIFNPRQAAYEAFDGKLTLLKETIEGATTKRQSRDLESAVSCLLWMLGFSITQVDSLSKMQDAADILAVTPQGHYAVVECTTGLLKEDNKLPKLHDRAQSVKKSLQSVGHQIFEVLPVIVTTKSRDEIKPELEQAEKHGILVVAREDLSEMFNRVYLFPNPDQLFNEALKQVRDIQNQYQQKTMTQFANVG